METRVKTIYKVWDGVELLQLQGLDAIELVGEVPDSPFATHMAGNAFNGFMLGAFITATMASSVIEDDEAANLPEDADEDGKSSYEDESYSDGTGTD